MLAAQAAAKPRPIGVEAEADRRRVLLKRLGLLRTARVGWKQRRHLLQHWQHGDLRRCAGAHGRAELAEEEDGRRFAGVISRLPVPGARGVGAIEGGGHGGAKGLCVDAPAMFEIGEEQAGRRDQCGAGVGSGNDGRDGRRSRDGG